MLQLEGECHSIVELEISWEKETCIHVEFGNFIFIPIWLRIILYINRLFVINEKKQFFLQLSLITFLNTLAIEHDNQNRKFSLLTQQRNKPKKKESRKE